jgi:DNA-binding transcriptional LysR family regulator
MNFDQFETLYWVARLGGFRAASRHLKMTQPAISARIRELERELGIVLFDRSGRSARLTGKGEELVGYAEKIVRLASEIQQHVGRREAVTGRVRLGVTSIPARTWLPRLVRDLAILNPGIELSIVVESSEHMRDELLQGGLDVAFLTGPLRTPHMKIDPIGEVGLALLASPELGLPAHPLSPSELERWPIISGPPNSHLYQVVSEWFGAAGAYLRRNHACSDLATRVVLATEGLGMALASPAAAAREIGEGRLKVVATTVPLPALEYVVAFPMVALSPAVELVATLAKQLIGEKPDIQYYYSMEYGRV